MCLENVSHKATIFAIVLRSFLPRNPRSVLLNDVLWANLSQALSISLWLGYPDFVYLHYNI